VIQPLLQGWDGEKIHLNLVILPTSQITPLEPLVAGTTTPSLATANFTFDVHITSSDDLPEAGSTTPIAVVPTEAPSSALPLFQSLASSLEIDPAPKKAMRTAGTKLRKYLPKTYQQAVGYVAGSNPLCVTGSEYHCSLRQRDPPTYTKIEPSTKISWGRIVSNLLKNPVLGNATGLCRLISVTITDAALICTGGFLYVTLSSSSEASGLLTGAEELKVYATRFPPLLLGVKRSLFSPILFPLGTAGGGTGPSLDYGEVFAEVTTYDDGWAKAIHCFQPIALDPFEEADGKYRPVKEVGVRLGWDDEQLAVWMNRQLDPSQPQYDSPISVMGYRVDVRLKGSSSWNSLVKASGQVQEGTIDLGLVDTELYVTVNPAQLEAKTPPTWWLPAYFVNWVGPALGTTDALVRFLAGVRERAPAFTGIKPAVNLTYGQTYEFRVRLADNSGGGPTETDGPIVPGRAPVASIAFKRYIRPLPVVLVSKLPPEPDPTDAPTEFSVTRPLLHYPAVACTEYYQRPGVSVDQLLRDDYRQAEAEAREAGLPDPDVHYVRITVEAESFPQDPLAIKGYLPIYTATRAFPEVDLSKPLSILITWTDINDAFSLPTDTGSGPLRLPTARNLRIQLASLCKEDSSPAIYFGGDDVRLSDTIFFLLRRDSTSETGLYAPTSPSEQFSAYYLQPDSVGPEPPIPSVIARLGAALQLQNDGMTLRAPKGRRLILGCDSSLPHQIGPDGASLSFSTKAALALRWTVAIRLVINRDWTWRGFQPTALSIVRDGQAVGVIRVPFSLGNEAAQVEESQKVRTQTEIVFLDCVNPHAAGDEFPQELNPVYRVQAFFEGNPTVESDDLEFTVRLPITTAPKQTPKLASAGIAMSPYQRSDDYSSTQPRQKCLWFEFTEPLADVRDAYFARVLRNVPDPNVFPFLALEDEEPPSLGIDPETTRRIVRGQSADGAGITAMVYELLLGAFLRNFR
jgi:hypothetical protein